MDFVETRDPLSFVGARVMRHSRKARRRRQRAATATVSNAMKPDPGAYDADAEMDKAAAPSLVLFGWLTRYDARLDAYTLFLPDGAGATQYSRADVLQFVANPEFQLRTDADDAFPPPVEDTTNRFVGVPLHKHDVRGRVVCYRPFADMYRVQYDDGSRVEMRERDIVDALLAWAKRADEQERAAPPAVATTTNRKRRRSADLAAEDDETEEDEPNGVVDGVKAEAAAAPVAMEPAAALSSTQPQDQVAPPEAETAATSETPDHEFEFPTADDDEPMELVPLDDDDEEEEERDRDMDSINEALASIRTTAWLPPTPEIVEVMDDDDEVQISETPAAKTLPTLAPTNPRPVSYMVLIKPHTPTLPFDKRSMAFEFLRAELTKLLDAEECAKLETALVADVMTNRDIKDRDAVRRFVESGGLVVVNCVLNARARDALARPAIRYDRVLFVLKLLAMLPTPSEQQVMESSIGKTIGRLIKSRLHDQQTTPDAAMPKCIAHLAKWIKQRWIATMRREKPSVPNAAAKKKHMQRPTLGRPSGQRSNDPEPISRRESASAVPVRQPNVPSFAATSGGSTDVLGNALSAATASPRWQQQKSSLKPDWMRQKETLTRTRFTINTDANAERQHYQRDRMGHAQANAPGPANTRRTEDAGARGVYGRSQRLSFGPRWNVCEFFKDAPPSAVRRQNAKSTVHYRNIARPKSILRKTSKYRDDLTF